MIKKNFPGWRFFSSPAFPETRVLFFLAYPYVFSFLLSCPKKSRSSHPEGFCKKGFLIIIAKFTGKQLCQSPFFNKALINHKFSDVFRGYRDLQLYFKKRLLHRCFPVNFTKFLWTVFLQKTSDACIWKSSFSTQ